jgi:hypothetical protein
MIIRDYKKKALKIGSGKSKYHDDEDLDIVDGDLNELAKLEEVQYQVQAAQHDTW